MQRIVSPLPIIFAALVLIACSNPANSGNGDGDPPPVLTGYGVTYNANGAQFGSAPVDGTRYNAGDAVTIPGGGNLLKGFFLFSGWNTEAAGTGTSYPVGSAVMPANDLTLYAQWLVGTNPVPAKAIRTGTTDAGVATISVNLYLGQTEVTYDLWYRVRSWATAHSYSFANAGVEGNGGSIGVPPTANKYQPVTNINWRDAMVWCNALTEWLNAMSGSAYSCAYYSDVGYTSPIRSSEDGTYGASINATLGGCDHPYVKADASGFALPTSEEWELAARYVADWNGDGDIQDAGEYYPGNYASGAAGWWDDVPATAAVAWIACGSMSAVGQKAANALGIFDMSGNANEFVFTEPSAGLRMLKGGQFDEATDYVQVGRVDRSAAPYFEDTRKGFRVARRDAGAFPMPFPMPFRARYLGNGNDSGTAPLDAALYNTHYSQPSTGKLTAVDPGSLAKIGNHFAGWGVDRNGNGDFYDDGGVVLLAGEQIDVNTNTTLIAQWTLASYYVTYYGNGNTGGTAPAQTPYLYGATVTLPAGGSLANGTLAFLGWNRSYDGSGNAYQVGATFPMPAGSINLFALWQKSVMIAPPLKTFFTGTADGGSGSVSAAYLLADAEVHYELWYGVFQWALDHGYTFQNAGRAGGGGTIGAAPGAGDRLYPVSTVNWRDAIVWCNAYTEWYNAHTGGALTCAYYSNAGYTTPIRSSADGAYGSSINSTAGSFDNPYVLAAATGFRLPSSMEWELAARTKSASVDGDIQDAGEYYLGSWVSGGWAAYDNSADLWSQFGVPPPNGVLDGKESNDRYATYWQYYNGSSWVNTNYTLGSVRSRYANFLGFYDLSGSVAEWCFDWKDPTNRVQRGGSFANLSDRLQVGYIDGVQPYGIYPDFGLRVARTQ